MRVMPVRPGSSASSDDFVPQRVLHTSLSKLAMQGEVKCGDDGIIVKFENCRLLRGDKLVEGELWIRGNTIISPEDLFWEASQRGGYNCDIVVDCAGGILSPGFIDIQLNGGYGVDFSTPGLRREQLEYVARGVTAHGVTSFCPTAISSPKEVYDANLALLAPYDGADLGAASSVGAHLEGPFICNAKRGAHNPDYVRAPEQGFSSVEEVYGTDLNAVRLVTLAPELPGALDAVRGLRARGIAVAMGHSAATVSEADLAFVSGARMVTHLFNAMGSFHHRDPGLIGMLGRASGLEESPLVAVDASDDEAEAEEEQEEGGAESERESKAVDASAPKPVADMPALDLATGGGRLQRHAVPSSGASVLSMQSGITIARAADAVETRLPSSAASAASHRTPSHGMRGGYVAKVKQERPWYGIIADGVHCHPYSLAMAWQCHREGLVLITDASAALGLATGAHHLGDVDIVIIDGSSARRSAGGASATAGAPASATTPGAPGGVVACVDPAGSSAASARVSFTARDVQPKYRGRHAVVAGTDVLAGAIVPLDKCVRNLIRFTSCRRGEALASATCRPADAVGITDRGRLVPGLRADLVLLDDTLHPVQTFVGGKLVWQKESIHGTPEWRPVARKEDASLRTTQKWGARAE